MGEAARKGGRKGGVLVEGPAGKVLFNRLKNHLDSIRNTKNLKVDDFWCRYLVIKDFFIPLCESLLIDRYTPIWNKVIDGFSNEVVGAGREQERTIYVSGAEHSGNHDVHAHPGQLPSMIEALEVGQLYSNEEIFKSLKVSNAGGIRLSLRDKAILRAIIMTSVQNLHGAGENPYHDRLEGDILTYTAAGKLGQQTLAGVNSRLIEQKTCDFPIHGFVLIASRRDTSIGPKRWKYLGLLEYLRHYPDSQLDADGKVRKVWLFELEFTTSSRSCHLLMTPLYRAKY